MRKLREERLGETSLRQGKRCNLWVFLGGAESGEEEEKGVGLYWLVVGGDPIF